MKRRFISKSAHNATRFIPASKKCLIPPAGLTNSDANTEHAPEPAPIICLLKRRPIWRFFVVACVFSVFQLYSYHTNAVTACDNIEFNRVAQIIYTIDGDTLLTSDHVSVRLIGIDAPEIDHDTGQGEPGAFAARDYLKGLVEGSVSVGLVYDTEMHDRYGRLLAHVFLQDGTNVQAKILLRGLAIPYTYPPNIRFTSCYHNNSDIAYQSRLGIWERPEYRPVLALNLEEQSSGYRVVIGKIVELYESKSSLHLLFTNKFSVRIMKNDLQYFDKIDFNLLGNTTVRVQGKIYSNRERLTMQIRHPLDLTILQEPD